MLFWGFTILIVVVLVIVAVVYYCCLFETNKLLKNAI